MLLLAHLKREPPSQQANSFPGQDSGEAGILPAKVSGAFSSEIAAQGTCALDTVFEYEELARSYLGNTQDVSVMETPAPRSAQGCVHGSRLRALYGNSFRGRS